MISFFIVRQAPLRPPRPRLLPLSRRSYTKQTKIGSKENPLTNRAELEHTCFEAPNRNIPPTPMKQNRDVVMLCDVIYNVRAVHFG